MSHTNIIDSFAEFFEEISISPPNWPVKCTVVLPRESTYKDLPSYPRAASPDQFRAANGRGMDDAACRRSGLGEAIELASACAWGNETLVEGRSEDLSGPAFSQVALSGFSADQIADRDIWNHHFNGVDEIPVMSDHARPRRWIAARGPKNDDAVWLEAESVLIGLCDPDTGREGIADTNGCAAGTSASDARLRALLELVERDAAGRWWYQRQRRPVMLMGNIGSPARRIHRAFAGAGRSCWAFDITSDLGVPVVAAVSEREDTGAISLGFGAAISQEGAAAAAYAELAQMSLLTDAAIATGNARPAVAIWLDQITRHTPPLVPEDMPQAQPVNAQLRFQRGLNTADALEECQSRLAQLGCRVFFVDHTRPEFAVPVWRAVSPDLCTWKPRFGRRRLFQSDPNDAAPKTLTATELNPFLLSV